MAIDGDPQTGWSVNGGQGQAHTAVFTFAAPLVGATTIDLELLFEKYYAAGLGRFRMWATDDDRPVSTRGLPSDVEAILTCPRPRRSADELRARLMAHFLSIAPELAAARDAIRKLRDQMPAFPTSLVMTERPAENPRRTSIHQARRIPAAHRSGRGRATEPVRAAAGRRAAQPAGAGPVAGQRAESARRAGNRQSAMGGAVRPWLWCARPRISVIRGSRRRIPNFSIGWRYEFHARRLVAEKAAQADRHQRHLPAIVAGVSRFARQGSAKQAAGSLRRVCAWMLSWCADVRLVGQPGLLSEKIGGPSVFPPQPPGRQLRRNIRPAGLEGERRARIAIAVACTPSPSELPPTRCSRPSTPPAAKPASRAAKSRILRCNRWRC